MKRAFLVGINKYRMPNANLAGCINDVKVMGSLLQAKYHFDEVRIITDGQAVKANILQGLEQLISRTVPGDLAVFHYSGHGTQVPDRNGDEPDRYDEAICPQDTSDERSLIIDDRINAFLARVPKGAAITTIFDSCHSGSADRNLQIGSRSKFLHMPHIDHAKLVARRVRAIPIVGNWVHISGCKDNQTSADTEFNGVAHGALTYALLQVLNHTPGVSYQQLRDQAAQWLQLHRYSQTPLINAGPGLADRPVFT